MKTCSRCEIEKEETEYYKDGRSGKLRYHCKDCHNDYYRQNIGYIKQYREIRKPDKVIYNKQYKDASKDKIKEYNKQYKAKNKANIDLYNKMHPERNQRYYKKHKDRVYSCGAIRRANKLQATPVWLTKEQLKEIRMIYRQCIELNKAKKNEYHVDHCIPLKSELVCGLHVPWNLQILTREENCKKSNKLIT